MNSLLTFSFGVLLTLVLSWLAFVVGAQSQFGDLVPTAEVLEEDGSIPEGADLFPKDLSGIAKQGAEEYVALGCISCHTQQVRLTESGFDVDRKWGKRPSVARDYVLLDHVLLGNTRIGPDLANIGLRDHSDEWLHRHLFDPQATVPGSICSPNPFLYEIHDEPAPGSIAVSAHVEDDHGHGEHAEDDGEHGEVHHVVPTLRARRIVAYLQALGQDYELPEMSFVEVKEEAHAEHREGNASAAALPTWLADQIASGKEIYTKAAPGGGLCFTCHQLTGLGLAAAHFPPLAGSEWVSGDKETLIKIAMYGLMGPTKVKGKEFGLVPMPPPGIPPGSLTDQQIADVLTYVRNEWGNSASAVSPSEVAAVRAKVKGRATMWTAAELKGGSE